MKKIAGIPLTGEKYVNFFGSLIESFTNGSFPKVDSLMMAISLATKNQLIDYFTGLYQEMLKCQLDLILDVAKPRYRGKILSVYRICQLNLLEMYDDHPKFFSSTESLDVKNRILDGLKIAREKVNREYSEQFVRYHEDLFDQTLSRYVRKRTESGVRHIDPRILIQNHSRLKTRILNEVYMLIEFGVDKNVKSSLKKALDLDFMKYRNWNERQIDETQARRVAIGSVTATGAAVGLTVGGIAASSAATAAVVSVSFILLTGGMAATAAAGFSFYRWYDLRSSR